MAGYIQTYVQRDVRLIRNIENLGIFNRFISLCAHYAGQIVNREELAKQVGVDTKTILAWLTLLENSYIIFLLQPWHNNLGKRIVKSPKLYFYDTALLCHLLNIRTATALQQFNHYGAIFENWVIAECKKNNANKGITGSMYYFRDSAGNEIDLVMERDVDPIAIEIKASTRFNSSMLRGVQYWKKNNRGIGTMMVLYGGETTEIIDENTSLLSWKDVGDI